MYKHRIRTLMNSAPAQDLDPPPKAMKFFAIATAPMSFNIIQQVKFSDQHNIRTNGLII